MTKERFKRYIKERSNTKNKTKKKIGERRIRETKKRDWDFNHFAMFGIKPEKWFKSLEDKINSKEKLLLQLSTIRKDKTEYKTQYKTEIKGYITEYKT